MKKLIVFCIILINITPHIRSRSPHRKRDIDMPEIKAYWDNNSRVYTLRDYHLHYWAMFTRCDRKFLLDQQIPPNSNITFRYDPSKSIRSTKLHTLVGQTITEVRASHKKAESLEHATVLKDRDFNYRKQCGTIILKLRNYPFIIKLFSETPKTFIQPFSKGIEPSFFYHMAGGINRYLAGFTRPKNLHAIQKKINQSEKWRTMITTPRQWFWIPEHGDWLHIKGKNFGSKKEHHITLPAVYAIICDAIESDTPLKVTNKKHRNITFDLTNYLGNRIDPHIDNFIIEKSTEKIAIIDTEHFASMVGLREPVKFYNYISWYTQLASKYVKDTYLQSKKERHAYQTEHIPDNLNLEESV